MRSARLFFRPLRPTLLLPLLLSVPAQWTAVSMVWPLAIMKSLLSILVHLGVLQTCLAASKCYYPNGDESADYPCDPDAEESVCCADASVGFACLSNKLCLSPGGRTARGSCTDKTWKSPECKEMLLCTSEYRQRLLPQWHPRGFNRFIADLKMQTTTTGAGT
jgi:hypothetical protein